MPTYDYECDSCGYSFELFQSISAPVQKKCPDCGKSKLRRLFGTGAAVVFKGSGFYQTDYRSESYKQKAEADRKASSESTTTSSGSSETHSETKASEKKTSEPKTSERKTSEPKTGEKTPSARKPK